MDLLKNKTVKRIGVAVGIAFALYIVFGKLFPLMIPFFIAFLLVSILNPWIRLVHEKIKLPRAVGVISGFLFIGILFFFAGKYCLGLLVKQIQHLIEDIPFYQAYFQGYLKNCCVYVENQFHMQEGTAYLYATALLEKLVTNMESNFLPKITSTSIQVFRTLLSMVVIVFTTFAATILLSKNYEKIKAALNGNGKENFFSEIWGKLAEAGGAYLKAQAVIMLLNTIVCSVAFYIVGNPYFFMIGILIAIVDALPILGSGTVLIPWSIYMLFAGKWSQAVLLLATYFLCCIIRQMTESKLIGKKIGIGAFTTLVMMYTGYQIFGIFGFFIGPVAFLIGRELFLKVDAYL